MGTVEDDLFEDFGDLDGLLDDAYQRPPKQERLPPASKRIMTEHALASRVPPGVRRMVLTAEYNPERPYVVEFHPSTIFRPEALQVFGATEESWLHAAKTGRRDCFPMNTGIEHRQRLSLLAFSQPLTPLPFQMWANSVGELFSFHVVGPWTAMWLSGKGVEV